MKQDMFSNVNKNVRKKETVIFNPQNPFSVSKSDEVKKEHKGYKKNPDGSYSIDSKTKSEEEIAREKAEREKRIAEDKSEHPAKRIKGRTVEYTR
jgi:hypothetical protein